MTIHTHAAPSPESDEQYVREVIDSAMSGSRSHLDLAAGALARGRRLRTRRRVAMASVAVAAGVLVAATAPSVLGGGHSSSTGGNLVATQPPAPDPVLPYVPSDWWDMPSTDMVDAVRAILPDGVTVTDPGSLEADTPEGGPGSGWINPHLSGRSGPGSLNVILSPGPASDMGQIGMDIDISCDEEFSGRTECAQIRDDDGTAVGRRLTNHWGGTVLHEVVLRRDGGTVYAASANTLDDKWGAGSPLSAESPPLTLDDLENLARNDVWVSYEP